MKAGTSGVGRSERLTAHTEDSRETAVSAYGKDSNCAVERSKRGTAGTHSVHARPTWLTGAWWRRAAHSEHPDTTIRRRAGIARVAEPCDASEGPAAVALNAVIVAAAGLPVYTNRTAGKRVGAAAANAPHPGSLRTSASSKYASAISVRVAEAGDTRESPGTKTLHAISSSVTRLADNARRPRASLPKYAGRKEGRGTDCSSDNSSRLAFTNNACIPYSMNSHSGRNEASYGSRLGLLPHAANAINSPRS
jgi:hypothetical protein